jgi:hypothetical protein
MHKFAARIVPALAFVVLIGVIVLDGRSRADAASIDLSWTAPTTNADGTRLSDLGGYRLYLDTHTPTCPGGSFHSVSSPTATPAAGQQVSSRLTSLVANTRYYARVTAVDRSGNESACSATASGVADADINVTPTTPVAFGTVAAGSVVDRTFTVQNTGPVSLSGSASVGAPYRILSGASFTLAPNARQNVVVRFQPTAGGTYASNVSFRAAGDTLSRAVSGSASGGTSSPPPGSLKVAITEPDARDIVRGLTWVVLWVEGTTGSANVFSLSAGGKFVGSRTTSSRGPVTIPWTPTASGSTTLTASVRDAAGRTGSVSIPVTVEGAGGIVTPPPPPSGTIKVAITAPQEDTLVRRGTTVVLWAEGTSGSSNSFSLFANGKYVSGVTTSSRGPVTIPWTATRNGTNTLSALVRDAAGRTSSTTIQVWVVEASAAVRSPSNDTQNVFVTRPLEGATVSESARTVAWVEGATGSRGPVSVPWTASVANGRHTLTAMVRDASGHTGRTGIPVTVRN